MGNERVGEVEEQSPSTERELTLDEAVAVAIVLQKGEQFVEAAELYRRVLEADPVHPDALHFAGVLAHQQGRHDEAIALIQRSLAIGWRRLCLQDLECVLNTVNRELVTMLIDGGKYLSLFNQLTNCGDVVEANHLHLIRSSCRPQSCHRRTIARGCRWRDRASRCR